MRTTNRNVFINCPFDKEFALCFEAVVFAITASGYRARCALEESDGAKIRLTKLITLITESARTIHDLSRTQLSKKSGLPRFNMPFELGLAMGAKYFGNDRQRQNTALVMVKKPYIWTAYLSDLGGNDAVAHNGDPEEVIGIVNRYLDRTPEGEVPPGAIWLAKKFWLFRKSVPVMAAATKRRRSEIDPFKDYRIYLSFLTEFLREAKRAGR